MPKAVITVSVDLENLTELDEKIAKKLYTSRSHAVNCMIHAGLGKADPPPIPVRGRPLSAEQRKLERTEKLCEMLSLYGWWLEKEPGNVVSMKTGYRPGDFIDVLGAVEYSWYIKNGSFVHVYWGTKYGHYVPSMRAAFLT